MNLIDYVDKNHETKAVKFSLIAAFLGFMLTAAYGLYAMPVHAEYCQSASDNYTCLNK